VTTADATRSERSAAPTAAEAMTALVSVVRRLRHTPIPVDPAASEHWKASFAPRHLAALLHIAGDEPISVSALAERLGVSLATTSQLVTDLADGGMVERYDDPGDRRRTLVRVADRHRTTIDAMLDSRLRPMERALARMRPAEQKAFLVGLQHLERELMPTTCTTKDD